MCTAPRVSGAVGVARGQNWEKGFPSVDDSREIEEFSDQRRKGVACRFTRPCGHKPVRVDQRAGLAPGKERSVVKDQKSVACDERSSPVLLATANTP